MFKFYNLDYVYYVSKVYYQDPGNWLLYFMPRVHHQSHFVVRTIQITLYERNEKNNLQWAKSRKIV